MVLIDITGISDSGLRSRNARYRIREKLVSLFTNEGVPEEKVLIHFHREDETQIRPAPLVARASSAAFTNMKADRRERLANEVLEILELAGHSDSFVFFEAALTMAGRRAPQFA